MRRVLFWTAALTLFLAGPGIAGEKTLKNVLILIADDVGPDLGCYGNPVCKTPNLDALARNGVRFVNAYATVASCSASRACILSGMHTHENGQFGHAHNPHHVVSFRRVESLPFLLRRAGYWTGIVGKYHVAPAEVYNFERRFAKGLGGNRDVVAMAKKAREFLTAKERGKRPFLLVVGFSDPHRAGKGFGNERFKNDPNEVRYDPKTVRVPYYLPDRPEVRRELAEYYQATTRMDRGVGLVIEVLRELGELDNTLIIFLSDNGIPFPGAKTTLYEPGVHLPMIVSSPGQRRRGHANRAMVSFIDVVPTVLEWTGAKGPKYPLRGRSLLPILDEEDAKDRNVVFCSHQFHEITMYYPMRAIVTRRFKLIENLAHKLDYPFASDLWASPTWQGVLRRGDKMMGEKSVRDYLHRPRFELYDLKNDPKELRNLADDPRYAEQKAALLRQLRAWQRQTRDPWTILYGYERDAAAARKKSSPR